MAKDGLCCGKLLVNLALIRIYKMSAKYINEKANLGKMVGKGGVY